LVERGVDQAVSGGEAHRHRSRHPGRDPVQGVDADEGDAERPGQTLGEGEADPEPGVGAWPLAGGDGLEGSTPNSAKNRSKTGTKSSLCRRSALRASSASGVPSTR